MRIMAGDAVEMAVAALETAALFQPVDHKSLGKTLRCGHGGNLRCASMAFCADRIDLKAACGAQAFHFDIGTCARTHRGNVCAPGAVTGFAPDAHKLLIRIETIVRCGDRVTYDAGMADAAEPQLAGRIPIISLALLTGRHIPLLCARNITDAHFEDARVFSGDEG